jgi:D-sedoheptulose 7-phosphate isomerase
MFLTTKKILDSLVERYPRLVCIKTDIFNACCIIIDCYKQNGKVLVCGNGGSASDALHIVGELMKGFSLSRKLPLRERIFSEYLNEKLQQALPAISLVNEVSLMTAYANDVSAEFVFAQQVYGYGNAGDVLIALSTSGNSENVIYAAEVSKTKNLKIISFTGRDGGKLKNYSDVSLSVPDTEAFKVQELHLPIYHALCMAVENEFFGKCEE